MMAAVCGLRDGLLTILDNDDDDDDDGMIVIVRIDG